MKRFYFFLGSLNRHPKTFSILLMILGLGIAFPDSYSLTTPGFSAIAYFYVI